MNRITILVASVAVLAVATASSANAQLARVGGNVDQSSRNSSVASVAIGARSGASTLASSTVAGSSVSGSVRQTTSGGPLTSVSVGYGSSATTVVSTVCGRVRGDANLTSYVKSGTTIALGAGSNANLMIASTGRGSVGGRNSFVVAGNVLAIDPIPFMDSDVRIGSSGGRC